MAGCSIIDFPNVAAHHSNFTDLYVAYHQRSNFSGGIVRLCLGEALCEHELVVDVMLKLFSKAARGWRLQRDLVGMILESRLFWPSIQTTVLNFYV